MKLKRRPEDFRVEELADFPASGGRFALYRLSKRSMGTPEVIAAVVRRWNIPRRRISYGGLKDRHALTQQFVTIEGGPRQNLKQSSFDLAYLGQAPRPFASRDIEANRFQIVMRDMSRESLTQAKAALDRIRTDGLPNYFDDQRFGSLGESSEFVARAWCAGDFERALWLALADPNEHDRPEDRAQKELLRAHWKDWAALKAKLERSTLRSLVTYLVDHPADFRGAFARINADLRSLFLSAFQSFLWNKILAALLQDHVPPNDLRPVTLKAGTVLFPITLPEAKRTELAAARIPLPSARAGVAEPAMRSRIDRVLAAEGLELRALRIKHPRENFFSKGDRAALVSPAKLRFDADADDLYPGRHKLQLAFTLPRGAYATILVKRVTEV